MLPYDRSIVCYRVLLPANNVNNYDDDDSGWGRSLLTIMVKSRVKKPHEFWVIFSHTAGHYLLLTGRHQTYFLQENSESICSVWGRQCSDPAQRQEVFLCMNRPMYRRHQLRPLRLYSIVRSLYSTHSISFRGVARISKGGLRTVSLAMSTARAGHPNYGLFPSQIQGCAYFYPKLKKKTHCSNIMPIATSLLGFNCSARCGLYP